MVKSQKKALHNQWRRGKEYNMLDEDEELGWEPFGLIKRLKPKFLYFVFISLVSCCLVLAPTFLYLSSSFSVYHSVGDVKQGSICCNRSSRRSDICVMKGDIRTHAASSSVILYSRDCISALCGGAEKIRPYTRKWEGNVMDTIDELELFVKRGSGIHHRCDVQHHVPAVFFSTGGYTGNLYHEFNDGILPLYITSHHMNKKVVFVILEYHNWWIIKYANILSQLSDFPPIDFTNDQRIHCFPEATIGLEIHDELSVNPALMRGNKTIHDFHNLLDRAYWPRVVQDLAIRKLQEARPKLVIVGRKGSRAINNQDSLVKLAKAIGFSVQVLWPKSSTELAKIYGALNSSDVMVGVHGAAMTQILFMRPGSVFIQVIPLGTDWAAEAYYDQPARKLGLICMGYKILPKESSLYQEYSQDDPILVDPSSVNQKGWEFTKKIYLDRQTVTLDLSRFRKYLLHAYHYTRDRKILHQAQ